MECSYGRWHCSKSIERTVKCSRSCAANNGETDAAVKRCRLQRLLKEQPLRKRKMEVMISPMQSQSSLQQMVKPGNVQMEGMCAVFLASIGTVIVRETTTPS